MGETERQMWGSGKDNTTFPYANFLSQKLTINFSPECIYRHYDILFRDIKKFDDTPLQYLVSSL